MSRNDCIINNIAEYLRIIESRNNGYFAVLVFSRIRLFFGWKCPASVPRDSVMLAGFAWD